jgi:hypothetical protein
VEAVVNPSPDGVLAWSLVTLDEVGHGVPHSVPLLAGGPHGRQAGRGVREPHRQVIRLNRSRSSGEESRRTGGGRQVRLRREFAHPPRSRFASIGPPAGRGTEAKAAANITQRLRVLLGGR